VFQISIEAINLLANFFYGIFGNGLVMTTVIFAVVMITLATLRVNLAVSLLILIPLALGFVLNTANSNMISLDSWIYVAIFMIAGLMFSLFLIFWWTR